MIRKVEVGADTVEVHELDGSPLIWKHPISERKPNGGVSIKPPCEHEVLTWVIPGMGHVRATQFCRHHVMAVQAGLTDEQAEAVVRELAQLGAAWP